MDREEDLDRLVELRYVGLVHGPRDVIDRHVLVCKACGAWRRFDNPMLRACLGKLMFGRCPKFAER